MVNALLQDGDSVRGADSVVGWLRPVIVGYLRSFHNRTHGTLVTSTNLREQLQDTGFANVYVLDRGVDSQLFTPERRCPELRSHWGMSEAWLAVL